MKHIFLRFFLILLATAVWSHTALAQKAEKSSKGQKEYVKAPPLEGPIIDRSGPPLITINGDEVGASSGKEEDAYSDEVLSATEDWQKQLSKMDKLRDTAQEEIKKEHDAKCKKGAATMKKLAEKRFLYIEPLEENCMMGGQGTKSAAALEQVQKTVGLYPNDTAQPLDAPDRGQAGQPTELTLLALDLLPPRPETGYTQQDIQKALNAINAKRAQILREQAKEEAAEKKNLEKAMKELEKNPEAQIFSIPLPQEN